MAPYYSKKKAKYTYTERVLGAISDLQKDHRKHAVHMATLRAHVRKTADARKDKMGPQWSQWVTRTVQRLADDGILDNSDPHGNVTFTPNTKKTITTVRRASLGPGTALTMNMEHKIWKDVTRRFSTIGMKRSRRRSSVGGAVDDSENGRPRKRQARKSFSRFTKAELEAELRAALKRLHDAEEPQPVDEQEVEELREELQSREQEVIELREEVARLKDNRPAKRRVTIGTNPPLLTPPPTNPSETLTPSSSCPATAPRSRAPVHGMIRTFSGSLISNLTRRPTPELSDFGSQVPECEDTIFDDAPHGPSSPAVDNEISLSAPTLNYGLETPQGSPILAGREVFGPESDGRSEHGDFFLETSMLKDKLQTPVSELRQLRDDHQRLLAEYDQLCGSIASRDRRMETLEADLRSRASALAASELCRAEVEATLHSTRQRLQETESDLQTSLRALDAERQQHLSLQKKQANLRDMVENLQSKVQHLTVHSEGLESNLRQARLDMSNWQTAHLNSEEKLKKADIEIARLQGELHLTQSSAQDLKDTISHSEASHAETRHKVDQLAANQVAIAEELVEARQVIESRNAAQAFLSARISTLEAEVKVARDQASVLTASNGTLEHTVSKLKETIEQLHKELSHAKEQATSASAALRQSQDTIDDLKMSHAQALSDASASTREAAAMRVTVSQMGATLDTLRSQLKDAAAETADVRAQLETEGASRRCAESELVATKSERESLLADIADKTVRLGTLTGELERSRQAEGDARRQLACLEAQHEKHVAAHATERSALESALETVRAEVGELKVQLEGARSELSRLSDQVRVVVAERDEVSVDLKDNIARVAALEEALAIALNDVGDAEDEIQELRRAKAADEASIGNLKDLLVRLRQVQMNAIKEVDSKVATAQTAPTPGHRRRSSIAPRPSAGRLA